MEWSDKASKEQEESGGRRRIDWRVYYGSKEHGIDIEKRVAELERKQDLRARRVKQGIVYASLFLVTVLVLNYL